MCVSIPPLTLFLSCLKTYNTQTFKTRFGDQTPLRLKSEQANVTAQLIFIFAVTSCLSGLCQGRCIGFALQLGLGGTSIGFLIPHDQGGHGVLDLRHRQTLSLGLLISQTLQLSNRQVSGHSPVVPQVATIDYFLVLSFT